MKKIHFVLVSLLLFIFSCQKHETSENDPGKGTIADNAVQRICASQEILNQEIASDPGRAKFLADLEEKTKLYEGRVQTNERGAGILYVPVVIHVVLTDTTLIPNSQITSQLQVLNKDFNKLNAELANTSVYLAGYPFNNVANCQIKFYISNIKRVQTSVVEFPMDNSMKSSATGGSDPVDPATKLNIWVCNTPNGASWGQFPGGALLTDGVVIDYAFFGTNNPYFIGRIATHEIGHWLNLRHIWGDSQCGDDQVQDTPKQFGPSSGCPAAGTQNACNGKSTLLMWMNYMDYSLGTCEYMFTSGQKSRMDATIDNARHAYFSTTKIYTDILP